MNKLLSIFTILLINITLSAQYPVRIWEEPLILPTYVVGEPDKNPMFFQNQSYQGASRYIYPYALEDNITSRKVQKSWKAVYLENEYIRLCVLPEIGGRLFYATDKTNGYEMFYRQHVIKPANIGMTGAWISGGIEFCVFHHHRASTNIPVDYRLQENTDGSATLWIGETEPRHRMKWTLGITLHPGKSFIEVDGRLINATENINSILYWANVATHVNKDYQIIFPPSTEFAVYHAKNSFAHWPVTTEVYNGKTYYRDSIDASWWKNHPEPVSMFAHDIREGFLAGYDHGKQAGTMHVGNYHVVKGAKLWEWGPGEYGAMWDSKVLTDNDGPYAELMTGAYSDNQPDYSWLKPYETKTFTQYWYPLRETGGAVAANLDAAVNLKKIRDDRFLIAANTTRKMAEVTIMLTNQGKEIFRETTDIDPGSPWSKEIITGKVNDEDLVLALVDQHGKSLIRYHPVKKEKSPPLPEPVQPPLSPEQLGSIEELYLTGLRIKQFHNARLSPLLYLDEALNRDSLDTRSNTLKGIILKENFRLDEAADHFRKALVRLTFSYTRPENCEPFFHLGVILEQQGKRDAAYDTLYRAAWDLNFAAASYYHLARISNAKGNPKMAMEEVNHSLEYNASNLAALNLKASLAATLGQNTVATNTIETVLEKDPLNFRALCEQWLTTRNETLEKNLNNLMRDNPESYLELAVGYLNDGFPEKSKEILLFALNDQNEKLKNYPTIHYYLGVLEVNNGNVQTGIQYFSNASGLPADYCFPFRFETIGILKTALEYHADDAMAWYYLGNILYDKQPDEAIRCWEKAVVLNPGLAIAWRNLGWGYNHALGNPEEAVHAYEKAIEKNNTEPRFYFELDRLYENNGYSVDKRFNMLTVNHKHVAKRPDALLQEIQVLILAQQYSKALEYLLDNFFPRQEGMDNLHEIYVNACLGQGISEMESNRAEEALKYFKMADEYPENHQIGRNRSNEVNARIFWYQATAYEKNGQPTMADNLMKQIAAMQPESSEFKFYKALACKNLGKLQEVTKLAKEIETEGNQLINSKQDVDFFSKFGEGQSVNLQKANGYYLLGLAGLINGNQLQANEYLKASAALNPGHLWAKLNMPEM